jgi:uncharacterized protein (TIGR03067 family)
MKRLLSLAMSLSIFLLVGASSLPQAIGQDRFTGSWEYKAVLMNADATSATKQLNELAAEGWELIGPLNDRLTAFKRPRLTPREIALQKELAKFEGEWESGDQTLIIKRDRWRWGQTGKFTLEEFDANRVRIVDAGERTTAVDLLVEEGDMKGQVCRAIFRLEGDVLRYCGSYGARPTGFDDPSGYAVDWKRVKK